MEVLETPETAAAPPSSELDRMAGRMLDAAKAASTHDPKAQAGSAKAATELFGSFFLGTEEFSLPASCIREVVNFPEKMTVLPLSPPFLEGMFNLRGTVIPVVNLAHLFSPEAPSANNTQVIAIIDYEQVLVGMLFDATGEILRVRPEQRSMLQYAGENARGVIAGTILLEDGARLLQILDAGALISIENVPQVLALRAANQKEHSQQYKTQAQRRQCVSFHVGPASFAFEMSAIQEIIRVPELQSSVLNSKLCLGRMNFRGSPVAVVDFATLLNAPHTEQQATADQRVILARIDDASIGFLVDSVDSIVSFFPSELLPIPLLSKARAGMFGGCISQPGGGEIIFLNHHEIFSQTEIVEMRKGHSNLYPDQEGAQNQKAQSAESVKRKAQRKVYITFQLESTFAVEITQIREIIDFPHTVVMPPGMPAFMRGILNLRQQMISIIDLRALYNMPPLPDATLAKILIVEREQERYGLLVDAVEDIMTIADSNRFPTPKLARNSASTDLRGEMEEVIDIVAEDGTRRTLSVFECDAFLQRLAREMPATGLPQ
ncbi:chemotaxis protein CheW [Undibacterium sp. TJN25]|uniref:chemotaxis protein CheW n=1 Tax=Undibacterium sp. TJN25 TaxID=3413056 RepID=UPI003BF3D3A9